MNVLQTVFNNAWHGLQKQRDFSYDSVDSSCFYNQPDTHNHCLIGFSIDDRFYRSDMEGQSITATCVKNVLARSLGVTFDEVDKEGVALNELQYLHDSHAENLPVTEVVPDTTIEKEIEYLFEDLRAFARDHGLTIPETKETTNA